MRFTERALPGQPADAVCGLFRRRPLDTRTRRASHCGFAAGVRARRSRLSPTATAVTLPDPQTPAPRPATLPRTAVREVPSPDGHVYHVLLAWPGEAPPPEGYPVIYVLDANAVFGTLVETIRMRSRRPDVTGVVPAVVVGIGYPAEQPSQRARRTRDYTPGPSLGMDEESGGVPEGETGGAAAFIQWIEQRLKPEVESLLPIDRSRQTLLGHSLGGYFALQVLLSEPDAFQRWVAASPSIWWDEDRLREGLPALARWLAESPRELRVMLTAGEFEQSLAPGEADSPRAVQTAARRASRRMIDSARELAARLSALPAAGGSRVEFALFEGADHASSLLRTVDRCLRFVLEP